MMATRNPEIETLLNNRYLRHILFWTAYVLTMTYIHGLEIGGGKYFPWFMNYLLELPIILGLSYSIVYWIIPKLIIHSKYWFVAVLTFMLFTVFSFLNVLLDNYIILPFLFDVKREDILLNDVLKNGFGLVFPVVIFTSLCLLKYLYGKGGRKNISEQNSLQMELQYIRSRMHPVFLRDALDDIYRMSNEKPEALPEMILKISEILHYFLYECDEEKVLLRKEEQAIRLFMTFQKMVFKDKFNYDFHILGDIGNYYISPYILFPLVRAAYRFNTNPEENQGKIFIQIDVNDNNLNFSASQRMDNNKFPNRYDYSWNNEINMSRQRLESIYSWKYKLDVRETERKLMINLSLQLN